MVTVKKTPKRELGTRAEEKAYQWFLRQGYDIIHKNWYHSHMEVDLILETKTERIFVEVKCTSDHSTMFPETKVHRSKRHFLQKCAKSFNYKFPTVKRSRFDVLAITQSHFSIQIYHIKDAFYGKISSRNSNYSTQFYA
jgi:putative endonuclease